MMYCYLVWSYYPRVSFKLILHFFIRLCARCCFVWIQKFSHINLEIVNLGNSKYNFRNINNKKNWDDFILFCKYICTCQNEFTGRRNKKEKKKTTTNQTNQRMILSMCAGGVGFSRKIIENIISTRPVFSVN